MNGYEPASGWNLPPGCFEDDPRAPWNAPDPWEGRTCGECHYCKPLVMLDGARPSVCAMDENDDVYEVEPNDPACEGFECV